MQMNGFGLNMEDKPCLRGARTLYKGHKHHTHTPDNQTKTNIDDLAPHHHQDTTPHSGRCSIRSTKVYKIQK